MEEGGRGEHWGEADVSRTAQCRKERKTQLGRQRCQTFPEGPAAPDGDATDVCVGQFADYEKQNSIKSSTLLKLTDMKNVRN